MAEGNGNGAGQAQAGQDRTPQLNVLVQYAKDLSFENPNAPRSLQPQDKQPNIQINVNVNANPMSETDFEVMLKLEGSAGEGADTLFRFELEYGGVFRLLNIPQEQLPLLVMIECPRLLFPFARQIVADAIRSGGFPPLYIDPIDFGALYQQRMEQQQQHAPVA
jgi:preprotein translocase subunit SecB